MADNQEDYELVPKKEVDELKKEINILKSGKYGGHDSSLHQSINELKASIDNLTVIFKDVRKDLLEDFEKKQRPEDLLAQIISQNKVVADTLVNLVSEVSSLKEQRYNRDGAGLEKEYMNQDEKNQEQTSQNKMSEKPAEKKVEEELNEKEEKDLTKGTSQPEQLDKSNQESQEINPSDLDIPTPNSEKNTKGSKDDDKNIEEKLKEKKKGFTGWFKK